MEQTVNFSDLDDAGLAQLFADLVVELDRALAAGDWAWCAEVGVALRLTLAEQNRRERAVTGERNALDGKFFSGACG